MPPPPFSLLEQPSTLLLFLLQLLSCPLSSICPLMSPVLYRQTDSGTVYQDFSFLSFGKRQEKKVPREQGHFEASLLRQRRGWLPGRTYPSHIWLTLAVPSALHRQHLAGSMHMEHSYPSFCYTHTDLRDTRTFLPNFGSRQLWTVPSPAGHHRTQQPSQSLLGHDCSWFKPDTTADRLLPDELSPGPSYGQTEPHPSAALPTFLQRSWFADSGFRFSVAAKHFHASWHGTFTRRQV